VSEKRVSLDDVGELAEEAMSEKTRSVGDEDQSRELWDVPTEPAGELADQQEAERR
jgi:hypothetical protein